MIHAINAWQTTAEKVFSQSRCEGERKEERVSGGRFKPDFESNSSVSLSRYMPEEGVFRSWYEQRWIDRERGRHRSDQSILPSQHPWKRSRLNPSLIVLHSSQDIVRIVICTPDKVSAHSRSYWAEHHHHHHRHRRHHAAFYTVARYEKFHDVRKYWLALDIRLRSS